MCYFSSFYFYINNFLNIIFKAHVLGSPTPKIVWFFEDIEIPTSENNDFEIKNNIPTEGFTRLKIKK